MTAACVHHRATGKTTLLGVALKAADFLAEVFRTPTPELARNAVCPSHYMGVVELYRDHARPAIPGPGPQADRHPRPGRGRHRRQPGPHPVPPADRRPSATPSGPTTSTPARPTSTPRPATGPCSTPCCKIWDDVVSRKMYDHRRLRGALRRGLARRLEGPEDDQPASTRPTAATTSCPTARPTTRPAPASATCSGTGGCSRSRARPGSPTSWRPSLYNAVLAGISLDGTRFFYANTLRQLDRMPVGPAVVAAAGAVHQLLLLPAERRPDDRRGRRLRLRQVGRRGLGPPLRRQHARHRARRRVQAEADAGDGLPLGRPGGDHGRAPRRSGPAR